MPCNFINNPLILILDKCFIVAGNKVVLPAFFIGI